MMKEFEMSYLGDLSYFLGMEFLKTEKGMVLHQKKYVREVIKRFKIIESNLATSYIEENLKLEKNDDKDKVDVTLFKHMVCY